jgi:molybdate/tungstate transport system substrate-binding protein
MNRRTWIFGSVAVVAAARSVYAQDLTTIDVAYAGSMGSMMEGPVKADVAQALQIAMHGRAAGSDALAKLIVGGSISPDLFISITPGPMMAVLKAGKANTGVPIARTEMVIAYSPKTKYAQQFAAAAGRAHGESNPAHLAMPWWQVLEQSGLRFGRTDPMVDPQGRNIIFTFQLAETFYNQPGLTQKVLGPTINPAQIFLEPTVQARLQSGELDAASAYKIQPGPFNLPYISLPRAINLGDGAMSSHYAQASLTLNGKTLHPEPLIYYATVLNGSSHKNKATAYLNWLNGSDGQAILKKYFYDPPAGAALLHA